jgi:hypothetical protein
VKVSRQCVNVGCKIESNHSRSTGSSTWQSVAFENGLHTLVY